MSPAALAQDTASIDCRNDRVMRGSPVSFRIAIARKSPAALPQRGLASARTRRLRLVARCRHIRRRGGRPLPRLGRRRDGNWLTHDDRCRCRCRCRFGCRFARRGCRTIEVERTRFRGTRCFVARLRRRSRGFARCFRNPGCREFTRRFRPVRFIELARCVERLRCRRVASVVAPARNLTNVTARAFVDAAFAGRTCNSGASTVAFATAVTTTTATPPTATRAASGTLAAVALGTLLLPITHRRCGC